MRTTRRQLLWRSAGTALAVLASLHAADSIVPEPSRVDDAEARLTVARILSYRRETTADAITAYERVLQDKPADDTVLAELAQVFLSRGEVPAAEQRLRAAVEKFPTQTGPTLALARFYAQIGRAGDAVRAIEAAFGRGPDDPAVRLVYATALGEAGRHDDARALFEPLLARTPDSPELLAAAGRERFVAGEQEAARDLLGRALALNPQLPGLARNYALTLAWTGRSEEARPRLEQLLRDNPADNDVIHAYAQIVKRADSATAVELAFATRSQADPRNADWKIEWAEFEAGRGHAATSRKMFLEALRLAPGNASFRTRYAQAAIAWGDVNLVERHLRDALAAQPGDASLREALGHLLLSFDRVEEADQWFHRWLLEAPKATTPWLGLVRLRLKEKNFPAALGYVESLLTLRPDLPDALALKAECLAALDRDADADAAYREIGTAGREFDALIGRGLVARRANDEARAAGQFAAALRLRPDATRAQFLTTEKKTRASAEYLRRLTGELETRYRAGETPARVATPEPAPRLVEYADHFAEQGEFERALACLKAARCDDPEYFPAWQHTAEFYAIAGHYDEARREFDALRAAFPDNRQILLGAARALAWGKRYEESLEVYTQLMALNPADPVPRREAARTAGWGKLRGRAVELYAEIWREPVDRRWPERLRAILADAHDTEVVRRWRDAEKPEQRDDAAEPFARTARFMQERFALRDALAPERQRALENLYVDILRDYRLQRAWYLENLEKDLTWNKRFALAERACQRLIVAEPGNEEAYFDLAQAQAAQGLGHRERATLERLLHLDAHHTLAGDALTRREIRSQPEIWVAGRFWREAGRGELSSIHRFSLNADAKLTAWDQAALRVGWQWGQERPTTRRGKFAYRGLNLGGEVVANSWLSGSVGFGHKEFYDQRIGHTDTGQAQVWANVRDALKVGLGYERREELSNEWALFEGSRSDHTWLGLNTNLTRALSVDGRLTATRYSDGNSGNSLIIQPAYAWTDHPRIFKTTLTFEYRDTDARNQYVFAGPKLARIVHPYWTPVSYTHVALTLELYRDYARQFFVGSEARWWDLRATFGTDSESNHAATFEFDWHHEWAERWMAHAGLYLNLSREWDALGLNLRLGHSF